MPAPSERARRKAREERDPTERIVGLSAARAVFEVRPEQVLHVAHSPAARGEIGPLLREAARRRIAYRELPDEELAKMAGSLHHEGICVLAKARPSVQVADLARALAASGSRADPRASTGGFVLALDQVTNPHNVGALLRSAAYFGAAGLLVAYSESGARADTSTPRGLGPAAVRIAEGGAEYVPVCFVRELPGALDQLAAAGAAIVGADVHEGEPLNTVELTDKCVLVVGNERSGLSPAVSKRCTRRVRIAGRGFVESLNVSVAAGILLAHAAQRAEQKR